MTGWTRRCTTHLVAALSLSLAMMLGAAPHVRAATAGSRVPAALETRVVKTTLAQAEASGFSPEELERMAANEAEHRQLERYEGGAAIYIGIGGGVLLVAAVVIIILLILD